MTYVEWDEPGDDGTHVRLRIPAAVAIQRQRFAALHAKGYAYANDEDALGDFLVIHWAWLAP